MDIIAGVITAIFLLILSLNIEKIQIPKKLNTALLSGFIVFVIITKRIILVEQKIGITFVSLLLIFAINLKIKRQSEDNSESTGKPKTKNS